MRIDVFHTHIEVSPYKKGDFKELEKVLSRWVQLNRKYGRYEPVGYIIENDTLYIPKGINIDTLENHFGEPVTVNYTATKSFKMSDKYDVIVGPRDKIQEKSIEFLTGTGDYYSRSGYCQYTLNLETAGGKTYCAIASLTKLGRKTLVIVNREILAFHWKKEIVKFTNIPEDRIMNVDTDSFKRVIECEMDADVYIIMHQTIQTYAKNYGWNDINEFMAIAGIGLKIYDEAHEFMTSTFMIDAHTNVERTFYLTATLGRSNAQENRCLNIILSASVKFDDKGEFKKQHIHYHPVLYRSSIPMKVVTMMKNGKGFSAYKFIDGALKFDPANKFLYAVKYCILEAIGNRGQILLLSPKKESVEILEKFVREIVGIEYTVGTIYSNNTADKNHKNQMCDIIVSTIKSCGTGFDPPNLQTIICGEPHTSRIMTHQLKGRLDRFDGDDTYFYDLIDLNIPFMDNVRVAHSRMLEPMCKEVLEIEI